LDELWENYTQFKSSQLEKTTILRDYGKIQKRIKKLPIQDLSEAVAIRNYLLKAYSAEVAKRTLKQLNACCNWAIHSKLIASNPSSVTLRRLLLFLNARACLYQAMPTAGEAIASFFLSRN